MALIMWMFERWYDGEDGRLEYTSNDAFWLHRSREKSDCQRQNCHPWAILKILKNTRYAGTKEHMQRIGALLFYYSSSKQVIANTEQPQPWS